MLTVTIDGKQIVVPEGTTVLQACEKAGSPVPFYCYHPGLSIAGNCRICLVEITGAPKLQIACYTRVTDGMVVNTTGEKTLKARQDVLEFLLINHPLDCPVCDQAGECWLQDYYMQHGLYDQRFNETKVKKPKAVPIGPTVMLDAERCILCSRCVRFTDEITKTGEFGIFHRGDHSQIGLHPGKTLDNSYAGNVVDICPVGALTDRDFRFKCRVWYLASTDSVCPGCSRGCNIQIHTNRERASRPHIAHGDRVMRLKPRYNPDVNQWWMCDEGRYGYAPIDHQRLARVQVSEHGALREGRWEDAIERMGALLVQLRDRKQLDRAGMVLSSHLTNEDLYVAKRFCGALGITRVAFARAPSGSSDTLLIQSDKSPNARGAQALGFAEGADELLDQAIEKQLRLLIVFAQDPATLFDAARMQQVAQEVELLVWVGPHAHAMRPLAHLVLPSAVYAEKDGTFTNFQGRVQRIRQALPPWGEAKPEWQILTAVGARCGVDLPFADTSAIFAELAQRERAFRGLTLQAVGTQGAMLAAC